MVPEFYGKCLFWASAPPLANGTDDSQIAGMAPAMAAWLIQFRYPDTALPDGAIIAGNPYPSRPPYTQRLHR